MASAAPWSADADDERPVAHGRRHRLRLLEPTTTSTPRAAAGVTKSGAR
jgi:hypothetical protein